MNATISGRRWAYLGAALGATVSIAANIAHSYVPPIGAAAEWSPNLGAVIGAVFWPVALFVATEILTRVAWPSGRRWQLVKWLGMLPVAAVAALVSYRHLSGLLAFYGEETLVCVLGPLAVDGLMVMATGAILATGQNQHTAVSVSVPASTSITVPAPTVPSAPAIPAAAAQDTVSTDPTLNRPEPAAVVREVPTPADVAARLTPAPVSVPARPAPERPASASTSKPRPRKTTPTTTAPPLAAPAADIPVTLPKPAQLPLPYAVPADLLERADKAARQYRTEHGTPITAGQLAIRLKVNSEQASQALAVLDLGPDSPTTPIPTVNGTTVTAAR